MSSSRSVNEWRALCSARMDVWPAWHTNLPLPNCAFLEGLQNSLTEPINTLSKEGKVPRVPMTPPEHLTLALCAFLAEPLCIFTSAQQDAGVRAAKGCAPACSPCDRTVLWMPTKRNHRQCRVADNCINQDWFDCTLIVCWAHLDLH